MNVQSLFRRALTGAVLALAVVAPAALGASTRPAAAAPTLEPLRVFAGGQQATVEVRASEPVAIDYSLREGATMIVTPVRQTSSPAPATFFIPGLPIRMMQPEGGVLTPVTEPVYEPAHSLKLTGLKSNTTYTLTVRATNLVGQQASTETTFTTLKRRVRVTLDSISVLSDADLIGQGEPSWFWTLGYPVVSIRDCFPSAAGKCKEGGFGTGTITPLSSKGAKYAHVFAEENFQSLPGGEDYTTMPADFVLKVRAVESDAGLGWLDDFIAKVDFNFFFSGVSEASWQAPQGVETASKTVMLQANDGGFRSSLTFRFELFHDNASYPPNDGRVHSTSK